VAALEVPYWRIGFPKDEFEVTVVDKQPYNWFWPWLLYIAFRGSKKPIKREIRLSPEALG
jgi:hypothetical protein